MTLKLFIAQVVVKYSSIKQTEPPSATQPSINHTDVPDPPCATCPPSATRWSLLARTTCNSSFTRFTLKSLSVPLALQVPHAEISKPPRANRHPFASHLSHWFDMRHSPSMRFTLKCLSHHVPLTSHWNHWVPVCHSPSMRHTLKA